ncbi:MAG: hypothetical protein ACPHGW_08770, partial [Pseudohongiellaceae bacterium]
MKKFNKLSISVLLASLIGPFGLTGLAFAGEDDQRAPPEARTSGTLSQQVMRAISEIQELMSPEDPEDEPNFAEAKIQLDELRERRYDRMNDFEKSTLLSFYTNYYLGIEDYVGAIGIFEEVLTIEELRADVR